MKVLTIMGSPRKKGNTYKVTRMVEESMMKLGKVEFEYVFLKDLKLKTCLGCQACFNKGEDLCPLKDDRIMLEEKMHKADRDHIHITKLRVQCIRFNEKFSRSIRLRMSSTRFFKNALIITSSGVARSGLMMKPFSYALKSWGFNVVRGFSCN